MATIETNDERSYFLIDIPCHPNFIESSFTLNSIGDDPKDVLENVTEKYSTNLTGRQRLIVKRLVTTGNANVLENVIETNATLSAYFHVTERTIRRDLAKLQSLGIIKHEGPDKGGKWVVLVKQ